MGTMHTNDLARPVVFLDFDGVVATVTDPDNDYSDPRVDWRRHPELGIRYNPAALLWIHELARHTDVRWLTSLPAASRTHSAHALVLPDFPAAEDPGPAEPGRDWKTRAVARQLRTVNRPVIWIEDDLLDSDVVDAFISRSAAGDGPPFFFVRTTPGDGLTEAHMIRIRSFLGQPAAVTGDALPDDLVQLAGDMDQAMSGSAEFIGPGGVRFNAAQRLQTILDRMILKSRRSDRTQFIPRTSRH